MFNTRVHDSEESILNIVDAVDNSIEVCEEISGVVDDLEKDFHTRFSHLRMIQLFIDKLPENKKPPKLPPLRDFIKIYEVNPMPSVVVAYVVQLQSPAQVQEILAIPGVLAVQLPESEPSPVTPAPSQVPVPEETVLPLAVNPEEWMSDTMSQDSYSSLFGNHDSSPQGSP